MAKLLKTFTRKCVKDIKEGDFELKSGTTYITSDVDEHGNVVVFTRYWARVPLNIFEGEEVFTEG